MTYESGVFHCKGQRRLSSGFIFHSSSFICLGAIITSWIQSLRNWLAPVVILFKSNGWRGGSKSGRNRRGFYEQNKCRYDL